MGRHSTHMWERSYRVKTGARLRSWAAQTRSGWKLCRLGEKVVARKLKLKQIKHAAPRGSRLQKWGRLFCFQNQNSKSKLKFKNENQIWKIKIKFVPLDWNGSQLHTGSLAGHRGEPGSLRVACERVGVGAWAREVRMSGSARRAGGD